jgi:GAF domain-containing protein
VLNPAEIEELSGAAAASPGALFEAIHAIAVRRLNAGLVTAMRYDEPNETVERLYSSNVAAYPVGGRKPKRDTTWGRHVLVERRVLLSAGDDAIRAGFPDHAIIFGLGLHSCLNIPLVSGGRCVGTLNVLRAAAAWTDEEVAFVRVLALAALAAVLALIGAEHPVSG